MTASLSGGGIKKTIAGTSASRPASVRTRHLVTSELSNKETISPSVTEIWESRCKICISPN